MTENFKDTWIDYIKVTVYVTYNNVNDDEGPKCHSVVVKMGGGGGNENVVITFTGVSFFPFTIQS